MKFGSVCSGIEAASAAFGPTLGWEAQWFSEIEPFPCAVLKHWYPGVPNLGDMTKIYDNPIFRSSTLDVLCGGTPCQSFSVAGLRKGLDGPRGNLALEFLRIAEIRRPRWILWENVPGVLSSNGGRDFGSFLGALGQLGYGFSYRVLNSEFFGVPQRRRRVFVVAHHSGDWRPAAAVLLERESVCRYDSPRGKKEEQNSGFVAGGLGAYRKCHRAASATDYESWIEAKVSNTLNAFDTGERDTHVVLHPIYCGPRPDVSATVCSKWAKQSGGPAGSSSERDLFVLHPDEINKVVSLEELAAHYRVRRLTPTECERLQGFPDGYTNIPNYKGRKDCPDGPRYKAIGNSWAVPCARRIGRRIEKVERILNEQALGDLL